MLKYFSFFSIFLSSCIQDCDHCQGISKNIRDSKNNKVFIRKVKLNKDYLVSPDLADTIHFRQAFIENVFDYESNNNYRIKIRENELRINIITRKLPFPFDTKWKIGEYESYYFMLTKYGIQCPILKESNKQELRFNIYYFMNNSWVLYDTLIVR
jgi:hypothetical protein